jgi:hypothetical protein
MSGGSGKRRLSRKRPAGDGFVNSALHWLQVAKEKRGWSELYFEDNEGDDGILVSLRVVARKGETVVLTGKLP